jgi:hypothetical protein
MTSRFISARATRSDTTRGSTMIMATPIKMFFNNFFMNAQEQIEFIAEI